MKYLFFIALFGTIGYAGAQAQHQSNMESQIKEVVAALEEAAARRDVEQLDVLLHPDYRVVANRFRGSETASIISKAAYLAMMADQKIGGTSYDITFGNVLITEHTAVVDLTYVSDTTSDMHKYLVLIQDEHDRWKVVSDIPVVRE